MSRIKITEYRSKQILLGESYQGVSVRDTRKISLKKNERSVVKVDQGIKKRFKQGLVVVDASPEKVKKALSIWMKKGYTRFIVEPFIVHTPEEEKYLSLERVREGIRILYGGEGGVDIEEHPEGVRTFIYKNPSDLKPILRATNFPESFLKNLIEKFEKNFFAFLEINPLIIRGEEVYLLDAAVLVDSAAMHFVKDAWNESDIVEAKAKHPAEEKITELQKTTPASLKLTVLHPEGSLFFLLSGGGGSIVVADEAELRGIGKEIGNYGEYSGGPSREETHLYTREVLGLLLASPAPKKALIIAGGIANFTDIASTFAGITDALSESADKLRKSGIKVFVRRGGPNEEVGLQHMKAYLEKEKLFGSIAGSDVVITKAVDDAIDFIRS